MVVDIGVDFVAYPALTVRTVEDVMALRLAFVDLDKRAIMAAPFAEGTSNVVMFDRATSLASVLPAIGAGVATAEGVSGWACSSHFAIGVPPARIATRIRRCVAGVTHLRPFSEWSAS